MQPAAVAASEALQALHEAALRPGVRYEDVVAVPAEYAMAATGAHAASLARWERDLGRLRTVVRVGAVNLAEQRLADSPEAGAAGDETTGDETTGDETTGDETTDPLAVEETLVARLLAGRPAWTAGEDSTAFSLPVMVDDRLWGELHLVRCDDGLSPAALPAAEAVALEVGAMIAVTERLQRVARMAYQDALTGAGNRRVLDETMALLLRADGPGATVVMCDIDNLKEINDEHGHATGDRVIIAMADALASAAALVPGATTVRLGGDEFVVLLRGSQRATAVSLVGAAARTLRSLTPPVELSSGIAVAAPGLAPADALASADTAQYAAKLRGALLVVASDLTEQPAERRRGRRRRLDRRHPPQALSQAVTGVVTELAERLDDAPTSVGSRLRWLAELLLGRLELTEWSLSRVALAGDRELQTDSLGLRETTVAEHPVVDLQVDASFRLDGYPTSARAIEEGGWFGVAVDDESADRAERDVLTAMGMRYVVALGVRDGDDGWLLELFARDDDLDLRVVGSLLSLGASALLHRPFPRLTG